MRETPNLPAIPPKPMFVLDSLCLSKNWNARVLCASVMATKIRFYSYNTPDKCKCIFLVIVSFVQPKAIAKSLFDIPCSCN